jgi:hypothetical protein
VPFVFFGVSATFLWSLCFRKNFFNNYHLYQLFDCNYSNHSWIVIFFKEPKCPVNSSPHHYPSSINFVFWKGNNNISWLAVHFTTQWKRIANDPNQGSRIVSLLILQGNLCQLIFEWVTIKINKNTFFGFSLPLSRKEMFIFLNQENGRECSCVHSKFEMRESDKAIFEHTANAQAQTPDYFSLPQTPVGCAANRDCQRCQGKFSTERPSIQRKGLCVYVN